MCRIDEFWNIHETFVHFFSKQAKLRQPHRAETADFRFQISNFEIRQIAFLMTYRPHKSNVLHRKKNQKDSVDSVKKCYFQKMHRCFDAQLDQKILDGIYYIL